jgi:4-alpha-glucanotransferase
MLPTKDWVKGYDRKAAGYRITKNKYSEDSTEDLGVIPTRRQKLLPEIQNTGTKILNTAPRNRFKDKEHKHIRRLRRDKTPFNVCKCNRPRA